MLKEVRMSKYCQYCGKNDKHHINCICYPTPNPYKDPIGFYDYLRDSNGIMGCPDYNTETGKLKTNKEINMKNSWNDLGPLGIMQRRFGSVFNSGVSGVVHSNPQNVWSNMNDSEQNTIGYGTFCPIDDKPSPKMWHGCPPPASQDPTDEENMSVILKKLQTKCNRDLGKTHHFTYDFATNKWSYRTEHE